jgi:endonuclease/exonuclease/phosphatase family metal-dependent hydrolase
VSLASLNLHGGVSGRGEPFDVRAACEQLKADIVTVQEAWRPDGQPDPLAEAADDLGARLIHAGVRTLTSLSALGVAGTRTPGTWGVAVLSVLPVTSYQVIDLGRAPGDRNRRVAQVLRVTMPSGAELRVVNTHLTHRFTSPIQLLRLAGWLALDRRPTVIAGDLNMPRPATIAALGYRPVVRGRTFPAHRPVIQLDHVLVGRGVSGEAGEVLTDAGSDHLPVRVVLGLD